MASKSYKFHGSIIKVLSGFGASSPALAITAISKAAQAVVTAAAHGLETGDVVKLTGIVGMTELNDGVCIVEYLTANTFGLFGVDSTDYTTYASGGSVLIGVYGPNFCELTSYNRSGAAAPNIDTSSMCSTYQESERGLPGFGTVELGYKFAPLTSVQDTLNTLEASGDITAVQVILPNSGGMRVHKGYVTQTSEQAGNGTIWTGTASLQLTGQSLDVAVV